MLTGFSIERGETEFGMNFLALEAFRATSSGANVEAKLGEVFTVVNEIQSNETCRWLHEVEIPLTLLLIRRPLLPQCWIILALAKEHRGDIKGRDKALKDGKRHCGVANFELASNCIPSQINYSTIKKDTEILSPSTTNTKTIEWLKTKATLEELVDFGLKGLLSFSSKNCAADDEHDADGDTELLILKHDSTVTQICAKAIPQEPKISLLRFGCQDWHPKSAALWFELGTALLTFHSSTMVEVLNATDNCIACLSPQDHCLLRKVALLRNKVFNNMYDIADAAFDLTATLTLTIKILRRALHIYPQDNVLLAVLNKHLSSGLE
jgi:hypothetical protein